MRINKFIALNSDLSRRGADTAIEQGRVMVNGAPARAGQEVTDADIVKLDNARLQGTPTITTIMLNKPVGYVVSRQGQGSKTIYDLLPANLHNLKPVGRLDKYSSGLLLLTNDGQLAQQLTHPKFQKTKVYQVSLDKPLTPEDYQKVQHGVTLDDGISRLTITPANKDNRSYQIEMTEGRNRQIRRTFESLGYNVAALHRTQFGNYALDDLEAGKLRKV